jgi:hypothetical protein
MGISSQDATSPGDRAEVVVTDETSGIYQGVETINGKNRALVDALVTVEEIFGQDPTPDSYIEIDAAGAIGDTIRLEIDATAADSTSPDSDAAAFDETYTLVAGDVGDELQLRDNFIAYMNAQAGAALSFIAFQSAKDIPTVHVTSTKRSLTGEFYERTGVASFKSTTTGTTVTTDGFDNFKSRGKPTLLARDPDSPHKLGILSGSFQIQPGAVSDRFELELVNTVSPFDGAMNVDGSSTPVVFELPAIADFSQFVTAIIVHGLDNGIKLQNFLGQNSALTNGLTWSLQSNEQAFTFPNIDSTREIKRFATAAGWSLDIEASADDALAIKDFGLTPIEIKKAGSFTTDDFIQITVNDDLTNVTDLRVIAIGFKRST